VLLKCVTFATFTVVADEKAIQKGGASTLMKNCESTEANTVRHLNDHRIFIPLALLIVVAINGSENFEPQMIPTNMFALGTIVSPGKSKNKVTPVVVTIMSLMTLSLEEDKTDHLTSFVVSAQLVEEVHRAAIGFVDNAQLNDENCFSIPKVPGTSTQKPIIGNAPRPGRPRGDQKAASETQTSKTQEVSNAVVVRRRDETTLAIRLEALTKKCRTTPQYPANGSRGGGVGGGNSSV